jgi:hypothetical protein
MVIIAYDGSGLHKDNVGLFKFKDNEELSSYKNVFSLDKFYSVTTANNLGENYYVKFDNIAKIYPYLSGLEDVFKVLPINEKDFKFIEFEHSAKIQLENIIIKHKRFVFRDSCGNYLPVIRDYKDLRKGEIKERFMKGEYVKYNLVLKDLNSTIISQHTNQDECVKDMENEIAKNTKILEELMINKDNSVEGIKKRNNAIIKKNPDYYEITTCEWPSEFISYLKDVYRLGAKLLYKRWEIDNG